MYISNSDLGQIVRQAGDIENKLELLGASGKGIHSKVTDIQNQLDPELVRKLRWIGTIRNNAVHGGDVEIDMTQYTQACQEAICKLDRHRQHTAPSTNIQPPSSAAEQPIPPEGSSPLPSERVSPKSGGLTGRLKNAASTGCGCSVAWCGMTLLVFTAAALFGKMGDLSFLDFAIACFLIASAGATISLIVGFIGSFFIDNND